MDMASAKFKSLYQVCGHLAGDLASRRHHTAQVEGSNEHLELYHGDGTRFEQNIKRSVKWEMDVTERRGALLRVLD